MGESILLHLAEQLVDKLASSVVKEVSLAWGLKDELLKMRNTLEAISAVIADAEHRQSQGQKLHVWLEDLKGVLHDTEDLLDDFECQASQKQVTRKGNIRGKVGHFLSSSNPVVFRFKMGHRIKEIRKRLDQTTARKEAFDLNQPLTTSTNIARSLRRETHSRVHLPEVIGRDNDRDAIIKHLLCPYVAKNPFIVSIVGIGGLGKTTLAKLVYNDNRVEAHFDKRIWVCVSEDFNVKQILQKIVNHQDLTTVSSNIHNIDMEQLQANLRSLFEGKKYLLVLDDLWNENRYRWNELSDLLTNGNEGSCIIVTTRSSKVVSTVNTCYEHKIEGLSHKSCMTLLMKPSEDKLTGSINPEIMEIASQIVRKCGGVPLVVKSLGGLLTSNADVGYWRSIKNKDIFSVLQDEGDILPIIKLSYDYLPPHLKRCFYLCSLFPKDYLFENITLGIHWRTAGLINPSNYMQNPDELAEQYMRELLSRSFFQDLEEYGAIFTFKMHHLMHELALSVAQTECSTLDLDCSNIPRGVQHVSISADTFIGHERPLKTLSLLNQANSCRTFILRNAESGISKELLKACISNSKYLRLLNLEGSNFEVMPSSIGTLKHLRLLNLGKNRKIRSIPGSICNLQSLQVLYLDECENLEELPRYMWKLINLEQLSITTKQKSLTSSGIGYLKSLKYLWIVECNNLESLFERMDVKGLTALRYLSVCRCASLISIPVQKLEFFTSLEVMCVIGCAKLGMSMHKELFPFTLRTIEIADLPLMSTLPEWFQGSSNTLESFTIAHCQQLVGLPEWLKDFKNMKRLEIFHCTKMASLPDGVLSLTSLKQLRIYNCDKLSDRCQPDGLDWNKVARIPEIEIDFKRVN